jgi:hypothetical protein
MAAAAAAVVAGHTDVPLTKLVILADDDDTLPDQASFDWTKAASEHLEAGATIFTLSDSPAAATTKASFVVASVTHNSSDELLRYACMHSHNFGNEASILILFSRECMSLLSRQCMLLFPSQFMSLFIWRQFSMLLSSHAI